jgi:hypothetical protein
MSNSGGFIGAVIVTVGIGVGVELFVAAPGRADEFTLPPDLNPVPVEGVEAHLDDLAA